MRNSKTGRTIAILAGCCLLLALGCGLLGLTVQQGVITPKNLDVQLGPLSIVTRAPRSALCQQIASPIYSVCDRLNPSPGPMSYHVWLFLSAPGRGPQSTRVLAYWTLPLRD